jgi:hypothetical protein
MLLGLSPQALCLRMLHRQDSFAQSMFTHKAHKNGQKHNEESNLFSAACALLWQLLASEHSCVLKRQTGLSAKSPAQDQFHPVISRV